MADYVITCCSAVDLTAERLRERQIPYVCFHLTVGKDEYMDDLWQSVAPAALYRRMLDGEITKTSQVSIGDYEEMFRGVLKQGKDLIHIALSSGISGTANSAALAARDLADEFPERKIYVIDSLCASSGYGLLVEEAADRRDKGMEIDALRDWITENRLRVQHWFFTTDLEFFIRGGRISKTAGFIGKVMNICPLLTVDTAGRLKPKEKIRSKRAVIRRTVEKMKLLADNGTDYGGRCYICHSECMDDAEELRSEVEMTFPKLAGRVEIYPIGPTIGCHTGPGTVAVFFLGKKREE